MLHYDRKKFLFNRRKAYQAPVFTNPTEKVISVTVVETLKRFL